jgi:hypothetical protein
VIVCPSLCFHRLGVVYGVWSAVWCAVCCVWCVVCGVWCVVCCVWYVAWGVWCAVFCVMCSVWYVVWGCLVCGVLCGVRCPSRPPYMAIFRLRVNQLRHSSVKSHRTNWRPQQTLSNSSDRLQNRHCIMSAADFHIQSPCAFLVSPAQVTRSVDLNVAVTYKSQNSLLCNFYSPLNV